MITPQAISLSYANLLAADSSKRRSFCSRDDRAFSLIELLGVVAIISILVTLVSPALTSVLSGRSTSRGAEMLLSQASVARQTAMTRNVPVALVVTRRQAEGSKGQAVLLLASQDKLWAPVGSWNSLPEPVQVNILPRSGLPSFYSSADSGALTGILPVRIGGQEVANYDYIVFYPDGSVEAPAAGPGLSLSRVTRSGVSDYLLVVQSASGRAKLIEQ